MDKLQWNSLSFSVNETKYIFTHITSRHVSSITSGCPRLTSMKFLDCISPPPYPLMPFNNEMYNRMTTFIKRPSDNIYIPSPTRQNYY